MASREVIARMIEGAIGGIIGRVDAHGIACGNLTEDNAQMRSELALLKSQCGALLDRINAIESDLRTLRKPGA